MVFSIRKKHFLLLAASFAIPFMVILICYITRGIAPFGDKCLMSMDAWGQYFPMLCERIRNASDWSFSGGLGFDLTAQSAYYTNSPLWLLLYLVPRSGMVTAVNLIVTLRFGLAGLTFCFWLVQYRNADILSAAVFSSAYALSAYGLAFINQFMWMDAVVLLPLVITGMERIKDKRLPLLYITALVLTLYSNFYIGYIVCLFCIIYYIILCFREKTEWKVRLTMLLRFSYSSLLSGGLCAAVLLPTYAVLKNTIAAGLSPDNLSKFYHSIPELLKKLLPFQKISLVYEAPNIYCGIICVALLLLYPFAVKNIRKTIVQYSAVIFFFMSFNLGLLDYVWHGFHFPNQLPGRQSFLLVFIVITVAYEVFSCLTVNRKIIRYIILAFLAAEISCNAVFTVCTQTWVTSAENYTQYDEILADFNKKVCLGDGLWRCEFIKPFNLNPGQLYGYYGISYYSSLMSKDVYNFFSKLGMEVYAKNVSAKYLPSNILNSVFGVKYLIGLNDEPADYYSLNEKDSVGMLQAQPDGNTEIIERTVTIYENPYALPIAFCASNEILAVDWEMYKGAEMQQKLLSSLCGYTVNASDENKFRGAINELLEGGLKNVNYESNLITGTVDASKEGILFISIPYGSGWTITIDGCPSNPVKLVGCMMGTKINKGLHEISINYREPLKGIGTTITLLCVAILEFMLFIYTGSFTRVIYTGTVLLLV